MEFAEYKSFLGDRKACNFCRSRSLEYWGNRGIFNLERCRECGLVFINPRLNAEGLNRFYADYFDTRAADQDMVQKRNRMYALEAAFLVKHLQGHHSLLDIGCGGGHFLDSFPESYVKIGTEIDPHAANYAERQYGIRCYLGEFPELQIEEAPVDVIILRGVIEHFANPRRVLASLETFLAPGGLVYITSTPNLDCICAELYRGLWNLVGPDHLYYFNEPLLSGQLEKTGLRLLAHHHFYAETPYADPKNDFLEIQQALEDTRRGIFPSRISPPFWGNMMTLLYQKPL